MVHINALKIDEVFEEMLAIVEESWFLYFKSTNSVKKCIQTSINYHFSRRVIHTPGYIFVSANLYLLFQGRGFPAEHPWVYFFDFGVVSFLFATLIVLGDRYKDLSRPWPFYLFLFFGPRLHQSWLVLYLCKSQYFGGRLRSLGFGLWL